MIPFEKASDPGFHIKVYPSGKKTFFRLYRFDGTEKFFNLGPYRKDSNALAGARKRCRAAQTLLEDGIDPQAARDEAEQERREADQLANSMGAINMLFEKYIEHQEAMGKRSAREVKRIWLMDIAPVIGEVKAQDITAQHIREVLNPIVVGKATPQKYKLPREYRPNAADSKIVQKSKPRTRPALIAANRCRSYLSAAIQFGIQWDNNAASLNSPTAFSIKRNPVPDVPRPEKMEPPGERVLTDSEVRKCWPLGQDPAIANRLYGIAFRLLMLTGQRVEQVLHARWVEFDMKKSEWQIPTPRTKKKDKPHIVPLSPLSIEAIAELRPITGEGEFLFPQARNENKPRPTNGFRDAIERYCEHKKVEKFTGRDLRRTADRQIEED